MATDKRLVQAILVISCNLEQIQRIKSDILNAEMVKMLSYDDSYTVRLLQRSCGWGLLGPGRKILVAMRRYL